MTTRAYQIKTNLDLRKESFLKKNYNREKVVATSPGSISKIKQKKKNLIYVLIIGRGK